MIDITEGHSKRRGVPQTQQDDDIRREVVAADVLTKDSLVSEIGTITGHADWRSSNPANSQASSEEHVDQKYFLEVHVTVKLHYPYVVESWGIKEKLNNIFIWWLVNPKLSLGPVMKL